MRIDLETIQKIELYLSGTMTEPGKTEFENQIKNDPELRNALEAQRNLMKGMEKIYVKKAAAKAGTIVKLFSMLKKGGIVLAIAVIISVSVVGINKFIKSITTSNSKNSENIIIPDLKKGEIYDPGKFITSQYFEIDGNKDTVIVGNNGVIFSIPAGSFVDENNKMVDGKIKFELKEALDPATIVLSGLSTFSDDKPLETGGMFYINATHKGKELKIVEDGILTSVPQTESKPGMMMFDGVVTEGGNINWINPKQTETFLLPVDMSALDFYPPGYYKKLKELETMPVGNASVSNNYDPSDSIKSDTQVHQKDAIITSQAQMDVLETYKNFAWNYESKKYRDSLYLSFESEVRNAGGFIAIDNYSGYLVIFDRYNNKIYEATNPALHNSPGFLENLQRRLGISEGISPAKVLAFWRPEFNSTYLATREFESRMPLIHQTCNNAILDLYVNNINKKLFEVDSMAANIAGGLAPEFLKFASYRHGNVVSTDKKYKMLQVFYRNLANSYAITAINVTKKFFENNRKADLVAYQNSVDQFKRDAKNEQEQIEEEYELNMNEAYRQLGKKRPRFGVSNVTATINSTGWKNVDAYVAESLITRTKLDYTDTNGKKAVIKYVEMNVSISNQSEFDLVNVYLIPDKLNAYMKVNFKDGKYSENLNELLTYDLLAVGYKSGKVFYQLKEDILPSSQSLTLNEGDLKEISYLLNNLKNKGSNVELKKTLEYSMFQLADAERKRSFNKVVMDREQLKCVIFPCANFESTSTVKDSVQTTEK